MAKNTDKKTSDKEDEQGSLQIVVFKLGQEEYGLHIDQIKEVVLTPNITEMPQTASFVKGVANIRGNVIAIFDLEDRFGLEKDGVDTRTGNYTLVVESEDIKLGLLVDEVPNTVSIKISDLDESVSIINDASTETNYIKGIIKSGERLIIMIDIFKVISQEETDTLKKASGTAELAA
jgi:purine-binding chemotaxis protein CheW